MTEMKSPYPCRYCGGKAKLSGKRAGRYRRGGQIARTYLYMQDSYPQFHMSVEQQKLMEKWNSEFPVDEWECIRAKRIEAIQGNENLFVKEPCKEKGVW